MRGLWGGEHKINPVVATDRLQNIKGCEVTARLRPRVDVAPNPNCLNTLSGVT